MQATESPSSLYKIATVAAVRACVNENVCQFSKTDFRSLPSNVLFDFYYTMYLEKKSCLLANEFSDVDIFSRILSIKQKRVKLLKCFQHLINNERNVPDEIINDYVRYIQRTEPEKAITIGIKIGCFFNEGSWYTHTIKLLNTVEEFCLKQPQTPEIQFKLLDCYHRRIFAETIYCEFVQAEKTFHDANALIKALSKCEKVPNFAGIYANFATLYFNRTEYDEGIKWSRKALEVLDESVPTRTIIEVLRQTSKAYVVKRKFQQASLLIRQALNLACNMYELDEHPHFSDTLLDYGFFLLNFDSFHESVKVYERSLVIRSSVFEKNNIHLALAHEDMAFALYVNEYSSGRFYSARENADRAIRLMERILPSHHLLLASAKRVKALILEEVALDMREGNDTEEQEKYLQEAESLHLTALELSLNAFGEQNVQTAKHYGNLGRLYQSMRKYQEAETMHLRAIGIKETLLGSNDYEVGLSIGHLASLYNYHMKRHADAEKLYMRSMAINLSLFGETYSGFEYDYRGLIYVYTKLCQPRNVTIYTEKMREWSQRRAKTKPLAHSEVILPLSEVKKQFFSLF